MEITEQLFSWTAISFSSNSGGSLSFEIWVEISSGLEFAEVPAIFKFVALSVWSNNFVGRCSRSEFMWIFSLSVPVPTASSIVVISLTCSLSDEVSLTLVEPGLLNKLPKQIAQHERFSASFNSSWASKSSIDSFEWSSDWLLAFALFLP